MNEPLNRKEQFLSWIHDECNPYRIKHGLKIIDDEEAERCWKILVDFHKTFLSTLSHD